MQSYIRKEENYPMRRESACASVGQHIYSERATSGCMSPCNPESLPGGQGTLVHHRANRLASQTTSPVLSPDDRHPHGVGVVIARALVHRSSPRTHLQIADHQNRLLLRRHSPLCLLYYTLYDARKMLYMGHSP